MKKIIVIFSIFILTIVLYNSLLPKQHTQNDNSIINGTQNYKGFLLDNILHSQSFGDIHYNVYIPKTYDGKEAYALYFTLPGYQGLYFQGIGKNLETEEFGFVSQNYNKKMIIVAPQLEDWGVNSSNQTIALVEYFLSNYNIDRTKVYANGYSGGGETMSLVMGKRPELFTRYLHMSSKWDGDFKAIVENRTPIYIVVGENDKYYGSQPSQDAYNELYHLYKKDGLSDEEINQLLILDIKKSDYFKNRGVTSQHGSSFLFAKDSTIMGWLFSRNEKEK